MYHGEKMNDHRSGGGKEESGEWVGDPVATVVESSFGEQ